MEATTAASQSTHSRVLRVLCAVVLLLMVGAIVYAATIIFSDYHEIYV